MANNPIEISPIDQARMLRDSIATTQEYFSNRVSVFRGKDIEIAIKIRRDTLDALLEFLKNETEGLYLQWLGEEKLREQLEKAEKEK